MRDSFRRVPGLLRGAKAVLGEIIATSPHEAAAALVWLLLLTITEGAGVVLLAPLLELVGVVEESPLPRAGNWLSNGFALVGITPTLPAVLLLFVGIAAARAVVQRLESQVAATLRENLVMAFRVRLYRAMSSAQWRFLVTRKPAHFIQAMVHETGRVGAAASHLIDIAVSVMVALVYLALALRLSPAMAVLVLGSAALLAWVVRGSLDRSRRLGAAAAEQRLQLHREIGEQVAALKMAKSFGATEGEAGRVPALAAESRRVTLAVSDTDAQVHRLLEFGSTALLAAIVYVSAAILDEAAALLLVMLFIFARLMPRLITAYRHIQAFASNLPVFESVRELERECREASEPSPLPGAQVTLSHGLSFEHADFVYLGRNGPALHGLSLEIRAGDTTAIVGESGSGKSTVADLLIGLLTPTGGRLLIDGRPLRQEQLSAWRAQIGYVSQDAFLFDDTIRNNVRWSRPDASDDDIWEALRLAAADRFVAALPSGIDTPVGDRGVWLSAGERQRLAIARALVRRPRLLVLDEATSSLDVENEQRIKQAVDGLHHRMTIVIITHRLVTIKDADRIYVLEGGRVTRSGTWEELRLEGRAELAAANDS